MDPRRHSYTMKRALLEEVAAWIPAPVLRRFDVTPAELRRWFGDLLHEARAQRCGSAMKLAGNKAWKNAPSAARPRTKAAA